MPSFKKLTPPSGQTIQVKSPGQLQVPENPIIPYVEGDGIGPDLWKACQMVLDAAVAKAYSGRRKIAWFEVFAGEKAMKVYGEALPEDTLEAVKHYLVAIKGPLTTPVGGGIRSLNVAFRQILDLYACVRPVRYFKGVPSPLKEPEKTDMVIYRENTEDVYAGIEWQAGTPEVKKILSFLAETMGKKVLPDSGIGIKPISKSGSQRLVRKAIQHALTFKDPAKRNVTLMHKGNIMKFTEGAFRDWGYELARTEFGDTTVTEQDVTEKHGGKTPGNRVLVKDRIADSMFQQILLRPEEYSVVATTNLNGDYISDALAAQVGGLGMAPGANIGEAIGFFEATHGTAPKYAGLDKVNPGSIILSGEMMLRYMTWNEAADLVIKGMERAITNKTVTYDLERLMPGAKLMKCSEFAAEICKNM